MAEVILKQDVEHLGKAGDRIRVRDGYSRNYLIPKKLAVSATLGGLRFLQAKKKQAEEKRVKEKHDAEALRDKLTHWTCEIKARVGEEGKLYGGVTRQVIYEAVHGAGIPIEKARIDLQQIIHEVGQYEVRIRLHGDVHAMLKVVVSPA